MNAFFVRAAKFCRRYLSFWHLKRSLIFLGVDLGLMTFVRRQKSDVVFVLRFDLLGDYIIGRNFLRLFRNYPPYQSRKIVLCANVALKELIETYDADAFDDFIWIDRGRLLNEAWPRFKILRQIKQLGAQIAVHPTYGREPYMGDCLIWATCAPERIGREECQNPHAAPHEPRRSHLALADCFYTYLVPEDHRITFDFHRNRSFFSAVLPGVALPENTRLTPIPVPVPQIQGPFAVVFPGASEAFREWPPERFSQVARHLFLTRGLRSVILGTQADGSKALAIQRAAPETPIDDLCGQLTLPQIVYLVSQCVVGITNDSGGIHLLAALNKPGVAISNGYSFGLFHPYPKEISDSVGFVYPPTFYALPLSWNERKEIYGRGKYLPITDVLSETVIERVEALLRGSPFNDPVHAMRGRVSSVSA